MLRVEGNLRANKDGSYLAPTRDEGQHCGMDLPEIITDCERDPASALLTFSRSHETDCTDAEALGPYPYNFAAAMITVVQDFKPDGSKRSRPGNVLPGVVHPKDVSRYVEKCRKSNIKRDFAELVWNCLTTEGVDVRAVPSIDKKRAVVQATAGRLVEAENDAGVAEEDWDFDEMISVDGLAASELRNKPVEIYWLCEDGQKAVQTSTFGAIEWS